MRTSLALLALALTSSVSAIPRGPGNNDDGPDNDGDDNDGASSLSPSPTAPPSTVPSAVASNSTSSTTSSAGATSSLIGMTGGVTCTDLLCIGGLVNGSNIQYTLQSRGAAKMGWMAMGFGSQMANTPMVIMWPNSDGSFTLSQRMAPAEVMPTVVSNPPRVATFQSSLSSASGANPKLSFTIPSDSSSSKDVIWAFGGTNPGDSAADAMLIQHLESGPTQLDITGTLSANSQDPTNPVSTIGQASGSAPSSGNSTSSSPGSVFAGVPLLPYERYIIAHAIMCMVGFLIVLPLGAILARWLRTFTPIWFTLHWVLQLVIGLPIIVTGVALGIEAVKKNGTPQLNDTHKKWGIAIFVLYFVQLMLGGTIHFFKPRALSLSVLGRPLQNYFHAILGLLIIGVSFYQVRTGFRVEWPLYTGRGKVRNGANDAWIVWLVLVPFFYFSGMLLLRRQYRKEAEYRQGMAGRKVEQDVSPQAPATY